jgi:signal transduction histidine kinase
MPSNLSLTAMGISLSEYQTYTPAKKARFQKAAQQKIAEIHESDIDAYTQLTKDAVKLASDTAKQNEEDAREDEEFR